MTPIELYRFVETTNVWTQTRSADAYVYNGETYEPRALNRTQIESKNEMTRANLDITLDITNPLAVRYLSGPVDTVVTLTLFVVANGGVNTAWRGRLASVKATGQQVTLSFESFFTSLRRPGLRARYQKSCRHALYGRGCRLNPEDFAVPVRVTGVAPLTITVSDISAYREGRFRGGMLRGPDGTLRFVVGSTGANITLTRNFDSLTAAFQSSGYGVNYGGAFGGVNAILYPGCAHNPAACLEFDNLDNYGGFPWIPTKNPFGGSSIV